MEKVGHVTRRAPLSIAVRLPGLLPAAVASCGLLPVAVASCGLLPVVACAVACAVERDKQTLTPRR
jgi:hypothetical protein